MMSSEIGPRISLFQSWEKKNRSGPIAPIAVNFSHFFINSPHVFGSCPTTASPP